MLMAFGCEIAHDLAAKWPQEWPGDLFGRPVACELLSDSRVSGVGTEDPTREASGAQHVSNTAVVRSTGHAPRTLLAPSAGISPLSSETKPPPGGIFLTPPFAKSWRGCIRAPRWWLGGHFPPPCCCAVVARSCDHQVHTLHLGTNTPN